MRGIRALFVGCLLIPCVVLAADPPVIDAVQGPSSLLPGATATLTVKAHSTDGAPLTFAWSTTAGQISGTGAAVTFTAPSTYGSAIVSVDVSSAAGTATSSLPINVALATFQGSLRASINAQRLTSSSTGELYAIDGRSGHVSVLTRRGDLKGSVQLPARAMSVAPGPGYLFVSLANGQLVKIDPATGKVTGSIDTHAATGAVAMAWDAANSRLWMVERAANRVRVVHPDGTAAFTVASAGGGQILAPVAVTIDPKGALAWVATQSNESGNTLYAFDLTGSYVRSAVSFGSGSGKVTRVGGVGLDASGNVWVSDMFQGVVQALSRSGQAVSVVGQFGNNPGDLRQPSDVALMANGDMAVASSDRGKLERYGRGAALPVCAGDSDCDGIPDAWEIAHGMNPHDASDAWATGADGLTNYEKYLASLAQQTRTAASTTFTTRSSTLTAVTPSPVSFVAGTPVRSGPGLVTLTASVVSSDACTYSWTQTDGPAVALRGATTLIPSFIGRTPGRYQFSGVATCGGQTSGPVLAEAVVDNVAPRPDAGRTTVVAAPADASFDGSLSSDANGDAVALRWDQILGPPLTGPVQGPFLNVHTEEPGLFGFMLTATDARGAEASADVPLLATSQGVPAPTAVSPSPLVARAGELIALDATRSYAPATAAYRWSQVDGPAVQLARADTAMATFVPPSAGRYAFELSVSDSGLSSPPARVDVFIANAGGRLPAAAATVHGTARLGQPVELDGSASTTAGGSLAYKWRIVSGPAAGLTHDDRAIATLVPFGSGSFVVELAVADGSAVGVPSRMRIDVPLPDGTLPSAVASAPASALQGRSVVLDGSHSAGSGPLRYRWTQVSGPWVPLEQASAARTRFQPLVAAVYEFELEVTDGDVRSAPARVRVAVDGGAQ